MQQYHLMILVLHLLRQVDALQHTLEEVVRERYPDHLGAR